MIFCKIEKITSILFVISFLLSASIISPDFESPDEFPSGISLSVIIPPLETGERPPAALGITVFGRPRVMTSEHCILQVANGCIHDCANCRLRARKLSLKNIDGKVMPVRTDIHGRSRLYDAYPIDLTPQVPQLLDAGVRRLMVDGTLLETDEIARAVARVRRAVEAAQAGRKPAARLRGATSGCMFVGIS